MRSSFATYRTSWRRPHLVHVLQDMRVSGDYSMAVTLCSTLQQQYVNTVAFTGDLETLDLTLLRYIQSAGAQCVHLDEIDQSSLCELRPTGVIFYNTVNCPDAGSIFPSIYYSSGKYDHKLRCKAYAAVTPYAIGHGRYGALVQPQEKIQVTLKPYIPTRMLRNLRGKLDTFTVGLFTSNNMNKYPGDAVVKLAGLIPDDIQLAVTTLNSYTHPGVELALADREARCGLVRCPVKPMLCSGKLPYMDAVIYASEVFHTDTAGLLVLEAMALGKPVICERKGVFGDMLTGGVDSYLYTSITDIPEYIETIRKDKQLVKKMAANARYTAGRCDVNSSIHLLGELLKSIGV